MKHFHTLFLLCFLILTVISCERATPEQKERLRLKMVEMSSYLTDNYTVGDSVFFIRETGALESFVVTTNSISQKTYEYVEEPDDDDDEYARPIRTKATKYVLQTILQSDTVKISITLTCELEYGVVYCYTDILMNAKRGDDYRTHTFYPDANKIVTIWATPVTFLFGRLQQHTGIIDFWTGQHSWKLQGNDVPFPSWMVGF